MTPTETAAILRQFNEWRRGDEDIPQFDPRKIGAAIDAEVEMIERMERQKPVATVRINAINGNPSVDFVPGHHYLHHNDKLYLAPGAQELNLSDPAVQKRLAAQWGYVPAGAQPAPSVPECPYPCGWQNLLEHAIKDGAYLARHINEDEPVTESARSVTMRMVLRLRDVLMALNNAAPEAKP